jgi:DNA-binding transcriptional MerR regulator
VNESGLRTGELAEAAGVNVQTLRYYERRGLLAEPVRSPGGHRYYPPDAVTLLGVIKGAQRLGFTLDEVADLLETASRRHPTGPLYEKAVAKLAQIDRKIAHLQAMRTALSEVIAAGCDNLNGCSCPDCPMPFQEIAEPDHSF